MRYAKVILVSVVGVRDQYFGGLDPDLYSITPGFVSRSGWWTMQCKIEEY